MTEDGTYTAVLDRFEDELAVLLLEEGGETIGEVVVSREGLPEDGRHVDAILEVEIEDGELLEATYVEGKTTERAEDSQRRFDELSQRPPSDEDDSS